MEPQLSDGETEAQAGKAPLPGIVELVRGRTLNISKYAVASHLCSGRVLALAMGEVLGSMHGGLGTGGDLGAESYSKEVFNVIAEASF